MSTPRSILATLLALGLFSAAGAQECDFPLVVQRVGMPIANRGAESAGLLDEPAAAGAVAIAATATGEDNLLFRATFLPASRRGRLEAFALPYEAGASPRWDASELLHRRAADDRRIFTAVDGRRIDVDREHARELMPHLGADGTAEAIRLVRYLRGDRIPDTRDRDGWKLGEIVHSTPVVVGAPRRFLRDPDYQRYLREHADRETLVYVGANDGLLHAFRARDGRELWAFAPRTTLTRAHLLADPTACAHSFVDLSPSVFDLRLSSGWRTVLIGGERNGGDSYFALDISDPEQPRVLWERSQPSLSQSFTQPALVRTPGSSALWTGSAPDAGGQAWLHRIDPETGSAREAALLVDESTGENMLGAATAIDLDFDGMHDLVYQATLSGRVLRWTREADADEWSATTIFDSGGQPIQARPSVAYLDSGRLLVAFGTGRYLKDEDLYENIPQDFYGIIDDPDDRSGGVTPSDLRDQSYGVYDTNGFGGWHFRLQNDGRERVIEPAAIVAGVVYFTSFAPHAVRGATGGRSWLYAVDLETGAAIDSENGLTVADPSLRSFALGEGIASRPVISFGDASILVQGSDARLHRLPLLTEPKTLKVRSWRETNGTPRLPDTSMGR